MNNRKKSAIQFQNRLSKENEKRINDTIVANVHLAETDLLRSLELARKEELTKMETAAYVIEKMKKSAAELSDAQATLPAHLQYVLTQPQAEAAVKTLMATSSIFVGVPAHLHKAIGQALYLAFIAPQMQTQQQAVSPAPTTNSQPNSATTSQPSNSVLPTSSAPATDATHKPSTSVNKIKRSPLVLGKKSTQYLESKDQDQKARAEERITYFYKAAKFLIRQADRNIYDTPYDTNSPIHHLSSEVADNLVALGLKFYFAQTAYHDTRNPNGFWNQNTEISQLGISLDIPIIRFG